VSKHATVKFNTGLFKAMHKSAVAEAVEAACSIDADNPKATEVALLKFTAFESMRSRTINGLFGNAPNILSLAAETLGAIKDLFTTATGCVSTFNTHCIVSLLVRDATADAGYIHFSERAQATILAFTLGTPWAQAMRGVRTLRQDLSRFCLFEPFGSARNGLHLGPLGHDASFT
jgi:hypothetical protein